MTIKQTYNMFLRCRSVYCSFETLRSYEGHLKIFFDYLETVGGKSIDELSFQDFGNTPLYSDFIIYLRKKRNQECNDSKLLPHCQGISSILLSERSMH